MNRSTRPFLTDAERVRILDELDQADARRPNNRRRWPRLEYRLRGVPVKIEFPDGSSSHVLLPTRNISCGGISLLMTNFLHVGTRVTVGLPNLKGEVRAVAGTVAFCRYIAGRVHEVGLSFTEIIEVSDFCTPEADAAVPTEGRPSETRAPLVGSVIVLSERDVERVLAVNRLKQTGLDAIGVTTPGALMDRLKRVGACAVVCDLAMGTDGWQGVVCDLVTLSPTLPVLGLVFPDDPSMVRSALQEGMVACLVAPLALADVWSEMERALRVGKPYVPSDVGGRGGRGGRAGRGGRQGAAESGDQTDDPGMVRFYMSYCSEAARKLHHAIESGDYMVALATCKGLHSTAPGYGFRSIAFAAREAVAELNATASTSESSAKLTALLNVLERMMADTHAADTAVAAPEEAAKTA